MPQFDLNPVTNPKAPAFNTATGGAPRSPGDVKKKKSRTKLAKSLVSKKYYSERNARAGEQGYRPGGHSGGANVPIYDRPVVS